MRMEIIAWWLGILMMGNLLHKRWYGRRKRKQGLVLMLLIYIFAMFCTGGKLKKMALLNSVWIFSFRHISGLVRCAIWSLKNVVICPGLLWTGCLRMLFLM